MEMNELFLVGKSPRRELQGPRPPPLSVRKDSHKIRKTTVAPANRLHQTPARQPVIIYAVSPKVIHTNPNEFMALVQRLTGSSSSSTPPFDHPNPFFNSDGVEDMSRIEPILSAAPASLPSIPANGNPLSFLHDLISPAGFSNNKKLNYLELSSLLHSPTTRFTSPRIISPLPSMDRFNHFFDL